MLLQENERKTMIEEKGKYYTTEILKRVDKICRENHIRYTLLYTTLLSQCLDQGQSPWLSNICIGLLYPEYLRLLDIIQNNEKENMYIVNRENDENFNAFFTQICMKSRVHLPEKRKKDNFYYDYYIYVYPIVYVGNKKIQQYRIMQKLKFCNTCMQSYAPVPFCRGLNNKRKMLVKKWWVNNGKKRKNEINTFLNTFFEKGIIPSKYVVIPETKKQLGVFGVAKTYECVEDVKFRNCDVMCIVNRQNWVKKYYREQQKKEIISRQANKAVTDGPETIRRVQMIALEILCEFDRICRKNNISYILSAGTLLGAIRHGGFIPWDDDVDVFMLNEEWQKFVKVAPQELNQDKFFLRTQETDVDDNLVFGQLKRNNTIYIKGNREGFNTHRGIALDILPFYNSPDSPIAFWLQDKLCHFFKTMTWAHMGYTSATGKIQKKYYYLLSRVSNKRSFEIYYNIANIVKTPKKYLAYLCVKRNPYHKGFNQRRFFEDLCEVEFEGHMFPAPREYDQYLKYLYGDDYMKLPIPFYRVNHHLPGSIELNGLYEYED